MPKVGHMRLVPNLRLAFGQVAWALSEGQPPTKLTLDQLRYLNQVGIPTTMRGGSLGRGKLWIYDYLDLMECGLALYVTRRGMKPREIAKILQEDRNQFAETLQMALNRQPDGWENQPWVRSRGQILPKIAAPQLVYRIHTGFSATPYKHELIDTSLNEPHALAIHLLDKYSEGGNVIPVPIGHLAQIWCAWALEAPEIKRGRKG